MLFDRAGRILHGHVPAAEVHHAPAHASVQGVERGLLQRERGQAFSSLRGTKKLEVNLGRKPNTLRARASRTQMMNAE